MWLIFFFINITNKIILYFYLNIMLRIFVILLYICIHIAELKGFIKKIENKSQVQKKCTNLNVKKAPVLLNLLDVSVANWRIMTFTLFFKNS